MAMPTIQYAIDDMGIAKITFDRDHKRNAFHTGMARELLQAIEQAEHARARVVILRANRGVKVWCAGHDLSDLDPQSLGTDNPMIEVFQKIQSTSLPVIAMVEGSVYAGGLLILLCADIVIAAENAKVAITAAKLGIPLAPEMYAFWLRVMGMHKVKELLFTAAPISAQDAYHAGLYNHIVAPAQLEQKTTEIARRIVDCSPAGVAYTKYQLNLLAAQSALTEAEQTDLQNHASALLTSPETQKRIAALLASLGN